MVQVVRVMRPPLSKSPRPVKQEARPGEQVNGFKKVSSPLRQIAGHILLLSLLGRPMRILSRVLCFAALMGTFLTALPPTPASAQETFFIPKDDGYGIGDCLATGAACARTVADAWCAAMGRGPSVSFGLADEAALERIATRGPRSGYRVTCAD